MKYGSQLRILSTSEHLADDSANPTLLASDVDPITLAGQLESIHRIDPHFPHFTDGRAYSQA